MKTRNEIPGYQFSKGICGKKWKRGRVQFSEGKVYTGNGPEFIQRIIKTNLDTGQMEVASSKEHKKFLTEEGYKEYLFEQFKNLAKNA